MMRMLAPWWAMIGFSALMVEAIVRLGQHVYAGIPLATPLAWGVGIVCVLVMLYAEGYRGFQKKFSPRFARRAVTLRDEPTPLRVIFAPFYCMTLFDAPRSRVIASWMLVAMIVFCILVIRQLHQPWRGAVDAGVVAGLSHGLLATLYFFIREIRR
jgi:hypothetical protein